MVKEPEGSRPWTYEAKPAQGWNKLFEVSDAFFGHAFLPSERVQYVAGEPSARLRVALGESILDGVGSDRSENDGDVGSKFLADSKERAACEEHSGLHRLQLFNQSGQAINLAFGEAQSNRVVNAFG
jgi:hypothetical protein